jgi:hypothetical protein
MILITCLWILNTFTGSGQQLPDLSDPTGYLPMLVSNLDEEMDFSRDIKGSVGIDFYQLGISMDIAYDMVLDEVNNFFNETGLTFYAGEIENLPHSGYSLVKDTITIHQIEALFAKNNRISVFLIDSIVLDSIPGLGYSFFPGKPEHNTILILKTYFNGPELARMLGHFFGLLNTHETRAGMEMVSGENCRNAGDFICDTPADGDILNQVVNCEYIGTKASLSGEFYVPSVANLMSEAPPRCRCIFTPEQERRIKYYYLHYRKYLR